MFTSLRSLRTPYTDINTHHHQSLEVSAPSQTTHKKNKKKKKITDQSERKREAKPGIDNRWDKKFEFVYSLVTQITATAHFPLLSPFPRSLLHSSALLPFLCCLLALTSSFFHFISHTSLVRTANTRTFVKRVETNLLDDITARRQGY